MSYFGPSYSSGEWRMLAKYKHNMLAYDLNSKMYTRRLNLERENEINRGHIMYIDGHAYTHKYFAGFINSCRGRDPTVRPIFQFVVVINDKYGYMERQVDRLIRVDYIMDLIIGDELLINCPFVKHTPTQKRREEQGLPKDVPKGRKPKNSK